MTTTENEFERAAKSATDSNVVREFWAFLCDNKKWWLLPIVITVLMLGALVMLSGSAAAPFIYTMF